MALHSNNYFEIFDLPCGFSLDTEALAVRYRELQRLVHPDRYAAAGVQEQRLAVQRAAQVNDAYQVLRDPLRRARYLLQLRGYPADFSGDTRLEPAFLLDQMHLRERMADLAADADAAAGLAGLAGEVGERRRQVVGELQVCFAQGDAGALGNAWELVKKLQFLYRLQEEIDRLAEKYD